MLDGLQRVCKECSKEIQRKWKAENPDRRLEIQREYRKRNPDLSQRYYQANKERVTGVNKLWLEKNRPISNKIKSQYRASKLKATVSWADQNLIKAFYEEAARLTLTTGIIHHVDHIVPLQGKTVSGLHWEGNLQILTASENCAKRNFI